MLKPTGSNVLLRRLPPEGSVYQKSIILLPTEVLDYDSWECEVLALGDGEVLLDGSREPLEIKVGDVVICAQGTENNCQLDDGSFVTDISAIEAVVENEVLQVSKN